MKISDLAKEYNCTELDIRQAMNDVMLQLDFENKVRAEIFRRMEKGWLHPGDINKWKKKQADAERANERIDKMKFTK